MAEYGDVVARAPLPMWLLILSLCFLVAVVLALVLCFRPDHKETISSEEGGGSYLEVASFPLGGPINVYKKPIREEPSVKSVEIGESSKSLPFTQDITSGVSQN